MFFNIYRKNPNRKGTLDGRVFAFSEDSFALPLTSKLDALFGENVSRFPRVARKVGLKQDHYHKNKNPNRKGWDFCLEVTAGFEPAGNGVADRGLTTWLRHQIKLERITGLEPATSTLARWRSTK